MTAGGSDAESLLGFCGIGRRSRHGRKNAGMGRDELLEYAIRMLRFNLESHKTGTYQWHKMGNTWISVLGIERMMPGIEAWKPLPEKKGISERVMLSEADHLLDMIQVKQGRWKTTSLKAIFERLASFGRLLCIPTPRAEDYIKRVPASS